MARSSSFTQATLRYIAASIGERLVTDMFGARVKRPLELAETFERWCLDRHHIPRRAEAVSSPAHQTHFWHHQIRCEGKGTHYARSSPIGPGRRDWRVHAIVESELAGKIDEGINLIDSSPQFVGSFVRLLEVPAFLTTCLWLENDGMDMILVVDAPEAGDSLVTMTFYDGAEFLTRLGRWARAFRFAKPIEY